MLNVTSARTPSVAPLPRQHLTAVDDRVQGQVEPGAVEGRALLPEVDVVAGTGVVEARLAVDDEAHGAPHHPQHPHDLVTVGGRRRCARA